MFNPELMPFVFMTLGGLSVAALVYALASEHFSGDATWDKRRSSVTENLNRKKARIASAEQASHRRQAVADTLKELEKRQQAKQKLTLRLRLEQAGIEASPNVFWAGSAVAGLICAILLLIAMPGIHPIGYAVAAFVGAFGLPRWYLGFCTKRRQKKFLEDFANAIDVIVRGVKSGLPLNDCLGIIARESPEPIRSEFRDIVEQQRVGVPLGECFDKMIARMPLAEVKFFAIVIGIQQKAGGNLSEALGNLSGVLRDRKMLAAKVKALSAEAKASAMVLGALPFIVAILVYVTTPDYISLMWTKKYGQFMLACAAVWMSIGIFVMKKMIDFKY
ncbi:MAG: type II secretion system F family protein [Pseudomonadota bacterium]